ncbi:D-2-hydroxyacid dehydrogenase [Candidatus Colwellia aromaticivorans]|uniref:D-2-hydroxyacid dehydrogenase n=1 Tax=Candidatus Colwellia aromaticivorans TaxID=2267621 RepID=UPI000DF44FC3|nr:D-2-hydroxyacid dehydrogenase [Candidatus Colwellia aromaticivorans]
MKAVFLDSQTFSSNISFTAIEQQVSELTCYANTTPEQVLERCQNVELLITNKVLLTAELLAKLPALKLICIAATGYNNIDISAATRLGIAVTNVSGYAGQSVAQYVLAQILAYYQQTSHHNTNTEQGYWQKSESFCYHGNAITELAGKTLGIIGYGDLGQAVVKLADAFGMNILISERINSPEIRQGRVSFDQVITQADIISLHCPQTKDTENLINRDILAKMKPTAMLINTARGALVNSTDLLVALTTKQIAYAVLDVLEQEPPPANHPLLNANLANLKITAHIAWASSEAQQRLIDLLSKNIAAYKNGERLNRLELAN